MNVLYTCEFALLVGGEGLLGLLLELLGSSRAGTVPLLRLQRPREALEQRAPYNTFNGWHFNFICKFAHKLVINPLYPNTLYPKSKYLA